MNTKEWFVTDTRSGTWIETLTLGPDDAGLSDGDWSIRKKRLYGGLADGVDIIEVDNGVLSFTVLPTRGMGLWKGVYKGLKLGWNSPVNGPVHPGFVNLHERGGLGWLGGFDEMLVRCGLDSMGAPGRDTVADNRGQPTEVELNLHGRIANLPASRVSIAVSGDKNPELVVSGLVDEAGLFGPRLRLLSRVSTRAGANTIQINDRVTNLNAVQAEMALLYHCNFGPPFLERDACLEVAATAVMPRDEYAVQGLDHYTCYTAPSAGFVEQVYWYELLAQSDGATLAMLRNATASKAVVIRFNRHQLPAFTQWKNTAAETDGYVTGLEPATAYPNTKAFERRQGRILQLAPGQTRNFDLRLEFYDNTGEIEPVRQEIAELQQSAGRQVFSRPHPRYSDIDG